MDLTSITNLVKTEALRIGFDAVGFAEVQEASTEREHIEHWLKEGNQAGMGYMERNVSLRLNPQELMNGAKSVISVALNYYPSHLQNPENPRIAYYAYGEDYHVVVKEKLFLLWEFIKKVHPDAQQSKARCFTDTAPILERYWAWKAGLGFIGKNTNLIIPGKGSFFFLGEIVSALPFIYDTPQKNRCGSCTRCMDACPTQALVAEKTLDARKCLSYLTIEHRGELPHPQSQQLENRLFGCDTCQCVCPWNRLARPNNEPRFAPNLPILNLKKEDILNMNQEKYNELFANSPLKRAEYNGLIRNAKALK